MKEYQYPCDHCSKVIIGKKAKQIIARTKNKKSKKGFCSKECRIQYAKDHRIKPRYTHCLNCGKEITAKYNRYCNVFCENEFQYKKYIAEWRDGKVSGGRAEVSEHVRRYIFNKFDNKCSKCKWHEINPFSNKSTLQIDHTDGDSSNHKEENLNLLCPNCHSLTATYGGLNKGKGRKQRREKRRQLRA